MLKIGSGWQKVNDESGKYSISIGINEEIQEMYPVLKNFFFNLYENKNKEDEKHPDFVLYITKKEQL